MLSHTSHTTAAGNGCVNHPIWLTAGRGGGTPTSDPQLFLKFSQFEVMTRVIAYFCRHTASLVFSISYINSYIYLFTRSWGYHCLWESENHKLMLNPSLQRAILPVWRLHGKPARAFGIAVPPSGHGMQLQCGF